MPSINGPTHKIREKARQQGECRTKYSFDLFWYRGVEGLQEGIKIRVRIRMI